MPSKIESQINNERTQLEAILNSMRARATNLFKTQTPEERKASWFDKYVRAGAGIFPPPPGALKPWELDQYFFSCVGELDGEERHVNLVSYGKKVPSGSSRMTLGINNEDGFSVFELKAGDGSVYRYPSPRGSDYDEKQRKEIARSRKPATLLEASFFQTVFNHLEQAILNSNS